MPWTKKVEKQCSLSFKICFFLIERVRVNFSHFYWCTIEQGFPPIDPLIRSVLDLYDCHTKTVLQIAFAQVSCRGPCRWIMVHYDNKVSQNRKVEKPWNKKNFYAGETREEEELGQSIKNNVCKKTEIWQTDLRAKQGSISSTCLRTDPKSINIHSSHQYLFALMGSAHVEAANKMLLKLTSGVDFTKHFSPDKKLPAHKVWHTICS